MKKLFFVLLGVSIFCTYAVFFRMDHGDQDKVDLRIWAKKHYAKLDYPQRKWHSQDPVLKNKKVVICGLAFNVASYLPLVFHHIYAITGLFDDYRIIIVENDSTDKTLKQLRTLAKKDSKMTLIHREGLFKSLPRRTHRIGYARNLYLDHIEQNHLDRDYDYLIVMDMDDVNAPSDWELDLATHVASCLHTDEPWDVFGANQRTDYYDLWALRCAEFPCNFIEIKEKLLYEHLSPKSPTVKMAFQEIKRLSRFQTYFGQEGKLCRFLKSIDSRGYPHFQIDRDHDPIEVDSCFGGLAIYNIKKIRGCCYNGEYHGFIDEDCEHVSFHLDMKQKYGARIYIHPKLLNH